MMTKKIQVSAFFLAMLSLFLLSGCEKGERQENQELEKKEDNSEQMNKKNEMKNESQDQDFDAKVQAGIERYIADNPQKFGKQVIESANAFQAEEQKVAEASKQEAMKNVPGIRDNESVLGDKNADIVLFEYSDYHCPFCKRFHPVSEQLVKEDNIAVVFRAMPLVHANTATPIHEIAECIAEKSGSEAFWKFTDVIFEKGESVTPENYVDELKTLNIANIDQITACYDAGETKEKVAMTTAEGRSLGIQGTPTSILKNVKTGEIRVVGGAYPAEAVKGFIAELRK